MSFIKALKIDISTLTEEQILDLEDRIFSNILGYDFYFEDRKLYFFKESFKGQEDITFNDYIEPWKYTKEFLIETKNASIENYGSLFSIERIESDSDLSDNLDNLIAKVPEDDEKLSQVQDFLNKIKK